MQRLQAVLDREPRIAYALVFGSGARGTAHVHSDLDIAIGLTAGDQLPSLELGRIMSALEAAAARRIDLVLLDSAPPGLAYRVFRDGVPIVVHDGCALSARKARAILEYLDFRPIEELCTRGVLAAAARAAGALADG